MHDINYRSTEFGDGRLLSMIPHNVMFNISADNKAIFIFTTKQSAQSIASIKLYIHIYENCPIIIYRAQKIYEKQSKWGKQKRIALEYFQLKFSHSVSGAR